MRYRYSWCIIIKLHQTHHLFMNSPLQFKFPAGLTVDQFIAQFRDEIGSQRLTRQRRLKTYYDTFDGRLFANGIICEFVSAKLSLKSLENDSVIVSTKLDEVPKFSQQFESEKVRQQLESIMELRALIPVCTVAYQSCQFTIINEDKKIMLRLVLEVHEQIKPRVFLQAIKGYEKTAAEVIDKLTTQLGLVSTTKPILLALLKQQGQKINDYSSKLVISLNPETQAGTAVKIIYKQLLNTIKANEQGTIADIDSEFLHDFRVAVRRTRAALSQLKKALPAKITVHYAEYFAWLGKITGETRDMDVYLLNFDRYKSSLPEEMREHLNPLHDFLRYKQQQAQQELAKNLGSDEYIATLSEWERYLKEPEQGTKTQLTIKQLADKRLRKSFQRVLSEGTAITEKSPCEDLHELRKSCKKLRYLLEFFQSLYDKNKMMVLLKSLKKLQEILGDHQDCAVQKSNLELFSVEMRDRNTPEETFLAIEQLIQSIDAHRLYCRNHFALVFAEFTQQETLNTFKSLFDKTV
jgi:CHAD domain-containing protein